jgi:hypothetical protein
LGREPTVENEAYRWKRKKKKREKEATEGVYCSSAAKIQEARKETNHRKRDLPGAGLNEASNEDVVWRFNERLLG